MTARTVTHVHTPAEARAQRNAALAKEHSALSALSVFAQLFIGMPLYLYANVGTPGYLSILLTIPYALLLLVLAKSLAKRGIARAALFGCPAKSISKALFLLIAAFQAFDALLVFLTLCATLREIMPQESVTGLACAVAVFTALGIRNGEKQGLLHLSRFIAWVVLALLLFCVVSSYACGRVDHLFPLLGYGEKPILIGAAWMCGCVGGCVWPLLLTEDRSALGHLTKKNSPLLRSFLVSVAFAVLWMLTADWLTPIYAMRRPETLGWRVLLIAQMTPSIPAWSMQVVGVTLLLLLALHERILLSSRAAAKFVRTEKGRFLIPLILFAFILPAAVSADPTLLDTAVRIAAWRAALMPALLLLLYLAGRKQAAALRKKEETA